MKRQIQYTISMQTTKQEKNHEIKCTTILIIIIIISTIDNKFSSKYIMLK